MYSFGVSVGVAGLARLMALQSMPGAGVAAMLALALLLVNTWFVLHKGKQEFLHDLMFADNAAYIGWSACTVALLSSFSPVESIAVALWLTSVLMGLLFSAAGVRELRRDFHEVDMAHISWFAWLLVAAGTQPQAFAHEIGLTLGWMGFMAGLLILAAAFVSVLRKKTFEGKRSPWFALGGAAGMVMWADEHAGDSILLPVIFLIAALSLIWIIPIIQLQIKKPTAWPTLFPLTNIAVLTWFLHLPTSVIWFMTGWCAVVALLETIIHLRHVHHVRKDRAFN